MNAVTTIFAPIIGQFVERTGERLIFFVSFYTFVIAAVILLIGSYFQNTWIAAEWCVSIAMGLIGFMNCAMNTIPYIFVGKLASPLSKGLYSGVFNCAVVVG